MATATCPLTAPCSTTWPERWWPLGATPTVPCHLGHFPLPASHGHLRLPPDHPQDSPWAMPPPNPLCPQRQGQGVLVAQGSPDDSRYLYSTISRSSGQQGMDGHRKQTQFVDGEIEAQTGQGLTCLPGVTEGAAAQQGEETPRLPSPHQVVSGAHLALQRTRRRHDP